VAYGGSDEGGWQDATRLLLGRGESRPRNSDAAAVRRSRRQLGNLLPSLAPLGLSASLWMLHLQEVPGHVALVSMLEVCCGAGMEVG
jgi:hypothetical protein